MFYNTGHHIRDISHVLSGINLSRMNESYPDSCMYALNDMENDLYCIDSDTPNTKLVKQKECYLTKSGDIIINLTTKTCSIVRECNANKLLRNAFVKVVVDKEIIDPWYFCFCINESLEFKRSISPEILSSVRPLSVSILGNAVITLPDIKKQWVVGKMYKNLCRLKYLNNQKHLMFLKLINYISNKNEKERR